MTTIKTYRAKGKKFKTYENLLDYIKKNNFGISAVYRYTKITGTEINIDFNYYLIKL